MSWMGGLKAMSTIVVLRAEMGKKIDVMFTSLVRSVQSSSEQCLSSVTALKGPDNSRRLYRFRSPNEFKPHAQWLYDDPTDTKCECKYCAKNSSLTIYPLLTPSLAKDAMRHTEGDVSAQKSALAIRASADIYGIPIHRRGELIWTMPRTAESHSDANNVVKLWPGIILDDRVELIHHTSTSPPLIEKKTLYTIEFLGRDQNEQVYDVNIIPFLAYNPSPLILKSSLAHESDLDLQSISTTLVTDHSNPLTDAARTVSNQLLISPEDIHSKAMIMSCFISSTFVIDFPLPAPNELLQYRGLWWGPERLWIHDLVRLKAERDKFPPQIQKSFLDPVPDAFRVGRSGVFLFVHSIRMNEKSSIPHVMGLLFEAVASEWAEYATLGNHVPSVPPNLSTSLARDSLPPPPPRCMWRSILEDDDEIAIPASLIAGQYYPHVLLHPLLHVDDAVLDAWVTSPTCKVENGDTLVSLLLAGLKAGWFCQSNVTTAYPTRTIVLKHIGVS